MNWARFQEQQSNPTHLEHIAWNTRNQQKLIIHWVNRLGNRFHNKGVRKHNCLCWYNRLGNRLTKLEMKIAQVSSTPVLRVIDWQIDYTIHKVNLIEINRLGNRLDKSQWKPSFKGNRLANRLLNYHLQNKLSCDIQIDWTIYVVIFQSS